MGRPFVARFLALCLLLGALALGTPRHAGPDEPAHAVRAAGIVRGQVFGDRTELGDATRTFRVPVWVAQPPPDCFAMQPEIAAGCSTVVATEGQADVPSTAASYPLLGHVVPGLATLLPGGSQTLYAARLLGVLMWSALLAAAFGRVARRGHGAVLAAMLAATPAALFTLVVINPSGAAVTGSFAAAVAWRDLADGDSGASALWVAGAAALLLTRPDGWMWLVVLVVITAAAWGLGSVRAAWAALVRPARIASVAMLAWSVVWAVVVRPELVPVPTDATGSDLLAAVLARTGQHVDEAIGLFGWVDTSIPSLASALWWAVWGAVVVLAWMRGSVRAPVAAAGAWAGFAAIGWAADVSGGAGSVGLVWQGRYALPLVIVSVVCLGGMPAGPGERGSPAALVQIERVGVVAVAAIWIVSLGQGLRRWSVGASGTPFPWEWQRGAAAVHPAVALAGIVAGTATFVWIGWREAPAEPAHGD